MGTARIAITIDENFLNRLDRLVRKNVFPNRSRALQIAVHEKVARIDRSRLARECSKLDRDEERKFAEEGLGWETVTWPEY